MPLPLTRRHLLAGAAALALPRPALAEKPTLETWVVPPEHQPVTLRLAESFPVGSILVDPNVFALYFILEPQVALKFTVGIARGNLYESGRFYLGAKKEWPSWTPTKEMIARDPGHYAKWADGMPGGPTNPLGARALYLFDEARGDTFLRIHGTPDDRLGSVERLCAAGERAHHDAVRAGATGHADRALSALVARIACKCNNITLNRAVCRGSPK